MKSALSSKEITLFGNVCGSAVLSGESYGYASDECAAHPAYYRTGIV